MSKAHICGNCKFGAGPPKVNFLICMSEDGDHLTPDGKEPSPYDAVVEWYHGKDCPCFARKGDEDAER